MDLRLGVGEQLTTKCRHLQEPSGPSATLGRTDRRASLEAVDGRADEDLVATKRPSGQRPRWVTTTSCRMYHGAVSPCVQPAASPTVSAPLQRGRYRRATAPATSPDGRAVAATAGPRCPRCRQWMVDQEAEAWPAVGRLPAVGWPIIEPAVPVPLIICELSMNLSI